MFNTTATIPLIVFKQISTLPRTLCAPPRCYTLGDHKNHAQYDYDPHDDFVDFERLECSRVQLCFLSAIYFHESFPVRRCMRVCVCVRVRRWLKVPRERDRENEREKCFEQNTKEPEWFRGLLEKLFAIPAIMKTIAKGCGRLIVGLMVTENKHQV